MAWDQDAGIYRHHHLIFRSTAVLENRCCIFLNGRCLQTQGRNILAQGTAIDQFNAVQTQLITDSTT